MKIDFLVNLRRLSSLIKTLSFSEPAIFFTRVSWKLYGCFLCLNLYIHDVVEPIHRDTIKEHVEVCNSNFNKLYHYTSATELRHNSFQLYAWRLFLSFLFGVAHASFACQRWGLPHRLAQCATLGNDWRLMAQLFSQNAGLAYGSIHVANTEENKKWLQAFTQLCLWYQERADTAGLSVW